MLIKTEKDVLIPKELADILLVKIHAAYAQGLPIREAVRKGTKAFNDYWRKKNADKSGG